jgi:hypothetical protein
MKKVFSLIVVLLLFSGCANLSVDKEEALKGELPKDFNISIYAEINSDVLLSQIIFDIQEKAKVAYGSPDNMTLERKQDCVKFFKDGDGKTSALAENIYLNYVGCPKKDWLQSEKCSGIYEQVPAYNKATVIGADTTWKCIIGGCWSGGWDETSYEEDCRDIEFSSMHGDDCKNKPLRDTLPAKIDKYVVAESNSDNQLKAMCKFVLPKAKDLNSVEDHLKKFNYDSTLVESHYLIVGRNEGRPYKYCKDGEATDTLRNPDLALKVGLSPVFYYYGERLFCFSKTDSLIYLLK